MERSGGRGDGPTLSRIMRGLGPSVAIVLLYVAVPFRGPGASLLAGVVGACAVVLLLPLAVRHARRVLKSPYPVMTAAHALTTLATLLIIAFSTVYFVVATEAVGQFQGLATKTDAVYFSVTVLSTVGFGDIVAVGQAARALVTLQMVFNLVVVATAIRLLSWALGQRRHPDRDR